MLWLDTRALPIPALVAADPALRVTYRYWHDLKDNGFLPSRSQVDTPQFRLVVPNAHWMRVAPEARPDLGVFEDYAEVPHRDDPGRLLPDTLGVALVEDCLLVARSAAPLFQVIALDCNGVLTNWQQLILPVADDGCRPSELLAVAQRGALDVGLQPFHGVG